MKVVPTKIEDFHVLSLQLPAVRSFPHAATHYLYFRPDQPKVPTPKTPRTLFLVNLPIDATETHVKNLFSSQLELPAGRIEEVRFEGAKATSVSQGPIVPTPPPSKAGSKRKRGNNNRTSIPELEGAWPNTWDREILRSGSTAAAVFVDTASMAAAVKAAQKAIKSGLKVTWGKGIDGKVPPLGLKRYEEHNKRRYPSQTELMESIDNYMVAFAAREEARTKALARQRSEPDADGFVTVTRGGRNGAARMDVATEQLEKQKEKQKGFDDFYRFQSREKNKEKAQELVRKFEEDKEKVRKMKEQRGRFKPE